MNKLSCLIHNRGDDKQVCKSYILAKDLDFVRLNCGFTCVHPKKKMKANWA